MKKLLIVLLTLSSFSALSFDTLGPGLRHVRGLQVTLEYDGTDWYSDNDKIVNMFGKITTTLDALEKNRSHICLIENSIYYDGYSGTSYSESQFMVHKMNCNGDYRSLSKKLVDWIDNGIGRAAKFLP